MPISPGGVLGELRRSASLASRLSFKAILLISCAISLPTLRLMLRPTLAGVSFAGAIVGGGTLNLPDASNCGALLDSVRLNEREFPDGVLRMGGGGFLRRTVPWMDMSLLVKAPIEE